MSASRNVVPAAVQFVDIFKTSAGGGRIWRGRSTIGDMRQLLIRFIGEARAEAVLDEVEKLPADDPGARACTRR